MPIEKWKNLGEKTQDILGLNLKHGKNKLHLRLILIASLIVIPVFDYLIISRQQPVVEKKAYANLDSIARLKAAQIENWLNERKNDGHIFISNRAFIEKVRRLDAGNYADLPFLKQQLEHVRMTFHYEAVLLLNSRGNVMISLGKHKNLYPATGEVLRQGVNSTEVLINNIQIEEDSREPYLDFIIPLVLEENARPSGYVIFHTNPKLFLFPFIQQWPGVSSSGETLLVRKDGDKVLFLNELMFQKDTSLKLKIPLDTENLPASVAIRDGKPGIINGYDYRGKEVLAAYRPVAGTAWFLVSKMDRSEVMSGLRNLVFWLVIVSGLSVIIISVFIFILLQQQRKNHRLELDAQALTIKKDMGRRVFALTQSSPDALITINEKEVILDWNPGAEKIFGYQKNEIIGEKITRIIPEDLTRKHLGSEKKVSDLAVSDEKSGSEYQEQIVELSAFDKDGTEIPIELSVAKWANGSRLYFSAIIRDISQRKVSETKIFRLTQLYMALSQCNEAIVRSTTKEELFPKICQNAVIHGGMSMAWIGLVDGSSTGISVAASFGQGAEFLTTVNLDRSRSDFLATSEGAGSLNQAIWYQDIQSEGNELHRKIAAHAGFSSSGALPLIQDNKLIGKLIIYSDCPNAFDDEVKRLLHEMQSDINFALENFAREAERQKAAQTVAESEAQYKNMIEQPLVGVSIIQNGRFVYMNPRSASIFGYYSPEELIGSEVLSLVAEKDRPLVKSKISSHKKDTTGLSYEFGIIRKDQEEIEIGVHSTYTVHNGKPAIFNLFQDITEKKQAEDKIQNYITQLQNAFLHTVEVVNTMSEMRDPYTAGHERRVAELAVAIGKEMGFSEKELEGLRISGWLHDLGKITIPAEMLAKPRKLTEAEYNLVKEHPQTGFDILKQVEFPWPVASVVLQHHERVDGSGYPFGLRGSEILPEAKIMAVADVVEAMASHRPYRPGLGLKKALEEIENGKGTIYDVQIAEVCLHIFREKKFRLDEI